MSAEVAVAGVADAYRGETVAAFVVLKPGIEASEETRRELLQYCRQELAAFKVPHDPGVPREPAQVLDRQGDTKRVTCRRLKQGR